MITNDAYNATVKDLNEHGPELAHCRWGKIQNDENDRNTAPYRINNYAELCQRITYLPEAEKEYAKARYFRFKCAMCDEYIFDVNPEVTANPDPRDKDWDFKVNGVPFDLKSTKIFNGMDIAECLANPQVLINRFYSEQSQGGRLNYQNRIFLVHHSYIKPSNTDMLRFDFEYKKKAVREWLDNYNQNRWFQLPNKSYATVLFVLEMADGSKKWVG